MTFSRNQAPRGNFFDNIKYLWEKFASLDRFAKAPIITGVILILAIPAIVGQQTGWFIHAGGSIYSTCIVPPPGFSQQDLDMISRTRKVNWCKTLAQNVTTQATSGTDQTAGQSSPSSTNFLSGVVNGIGQFFLAIRRLFAGY